MDQVSQSLKQQEDTVKGVLNNISSEKKFSAVEIKTLITIKNPTPEKNLIVESVIEESMSVAARFNVHTRAACETFMKGFEADKNNGYPLFH
jgi:hypothetical protein